EAEQERRERVAVERAAGAVRRGDVAVEVEGAGAVARAEEVEADLAEVGAELERVRADELRERAVGADRLPVPIGRLDRAERARRIRVVVADADLRELLHRDLVQVSLREA